MTMTLTITDAGRAALVAAANNGTNAVTVTQAGITAVNFAMSAALTAVPAEIKKLATLSGGTTATDTVHVTVTDGTSDVYDLRGIGFYLNDGTLFAIYSQATPILSKAAGAVALVAMDCQFANMGGVTVTFGDTNFFNPQATVDIKGVVELATSAETIAKTDATRAVTPKGMWDAFSNWISTAVAGVWTSNNDGAGSGLDADLLDGQHGAYYADVSSRLGYTPIQQGGGAGQTTNKIFIGWSSGHRLKLQVDASDQGQILTDGTLMSVLRTMDGSGSGLDADVLDGQDSGYYTNIVARLGYTPLNQTSYTAGDVIVKLRTVDGAGSGLDADLLDGLDSSYFTDIPSRLGYTPLNASSYSVADVMNKVRAGDGAGSGLDADLLDGLDSGFFTNIIARLGFTPVQQGGGAYQGSNKVYLGWAGGRLRLQVDSYDAGNLITDGVLRDVLLGVDGSGSGVDADLLDGQDSGYYTNIVARLGYTPLNQSSYTTADVKTRMLSVDGSGSGLDADLLDGQHGAYYADVLSRLGYTPVRQGGGANQSNNTVYIGWGTNSRLRAQVDASDQGNILTDPQLMNVLRSMDGSGSGLDADLLDGHDISDFLLQSAMDLVWNGAFGPNRFRLGSLLVQTGIISTIGQNGSATINFPIHYASPPVVIPIRRTSGAITNADSGAGLEGTPTVASAQVRNTTAGTVIDIIWIAIGPT